MKPTKEELTFYKFAQEFVKIFPFINSPVSFVNKDWKIAVVNDKGTTPVSISSKQNKIHVLPIYFKKLSKETQLMALMWCYYKRNGGNYLTDMQADTCAFKFLFQKKNTSIRHIYRQWMHVISNASTYPDYKIKRINTIKQYFAK